MPSITPPQVGRVFAALSLLLLSPAFTAPLPAQAAEAADRPLMYAEAALPDSPGASAPLRSGFLVSAAQSTVAIPAQSPVAVPVQIAPKYKRTIQADQTAVPLTAADKMVLSLRQRITPVAIASTLFSAGYSHLTDSRPHYGTDSAGFGERLGSSELRQTSQSFIGLGLVASILHDDPRYYVLGPAYSPKHRAIYAAERILITRKDNGRSAINFPQLIGIASAQAIANSYYPTQDQSVRRTITGTASSYGTTALVNEANEFLGDVIRHFRHKPQP